MHTDPRSLIAHGDDQVIIRGIRIEAEIGFSKHELNLLQPLDVDVIISQPARTPIEDTPTPALDYKQIKDELRMELPAKRFHLIEALAEEVARRVLQHVSNGRVTVTVHKPGALTGARDVAVRVTRSAA